MHLAMVLNNDWRVLTSSRPNDEERNDCGKDPHYDDFQKRNCSCYALFNKGYPERRESGRKRDDVEWAEVSNYTT